jgi:hypothetical protein
MTMNQPTPRCSGSHTYEPATSQQLLVFAEELADRMGRRKGVRSVEATVARRWVRTMRSIISEEAGA